MNILLMSKLDDASNLSTSDYLLRLLLKNKVFLQGRCLIFSK